MTLMMLAAGSLLSLVLLIVHSWRTRGRSVTIRFFGMGLLFGVLRGNAVWLIMQTLEGPKGMKPYIPQGGILPEIGHDSIQVAVGWVFALYLAWTVSEALLRRLPRLAGRVFMVGGLSALFMFAIGYCMETSAVSVGWWYWSLPTKTTLFGNVNLPGIWAWFSVAHDFLIPFLVIVCSVSRNPLRWLWLLAFPTHMASHLLYTKVQYAGLNHQAMLMLVIVLTFFSKLRFGKGALDAAPVGTKPIIRAIPGVVLVIFFGVLGASNLVAGAPGNLLTALPLLMLCLLAWRRLPVWVVVVLSLLALLGWRWVDFRALYACVPVAVFAYLLLLSTLGEKLWLRAAPVGLALALSVVVVVEDQRDSDRADRYVDAWREGDRLALAGSPQAAAAYARSEASRPNDIMNYYLSARRMTTLKGPSNEAPVLVLTLARRMPRLRAELQKIIERDEKWLQPREDLAQLYLLEGNVSGACEQYRVGYRLCRGDAEVAAMLGYLLLREGNTSEAKEICEKAAALKKPPVEALVNLGVIRLHDGHKDEARALWKRALLLDPENPVAQWNMEGADLESVTPQVDMRYLARPRSPEVTAAASWANDLAAYVKGQSDEEKLRLLNEAVQFDPLLVRGHLNLVRLYLPTHKATQDPARALWHAQRAVSLARVKPEKRELPESLLFLGYALIANGKPQEARSVLGEGKSLATGALLGRFEEVLTQLGRPVPK